MHRDVVTLAGELHPLACQLFGPASLAQGASVTLAWQTHPLAQKLLASPSLTRRFAIITWQAACIYWYKRFLLPEDIPKDPRSHQCL